LTPTVVELASNFPLLFGIDEAQAVAELGPNWVDLQPEEAYRQTLVWADAITRFKAVTPDGQV
jgi:hypothetical protein